MVELTASTPSIVSSSLTEQLWFKDAVIYEVSVRAFADSNGDGIGDFRGLLSKLDYLQDLGVTAIWLLPFFPSPLRDDGYDTSNYTDVNPIYGSLDDFKTFLDAAHDRDLRVIIELILNHTSDQHPWFQRARTAPAGSVERDFYVWSDTRERYQEARIIFQDFEGSNWSWDPVANAYYWHRFYSHQPDLNYENPAVQDAAFEVMDFWLDMGVDGLRLDAVPYLYERDGTNCENLPETHDFLKALRRHIDDKYGGTRMLLAEANQWPEDAVAYLGDGDECHMDFHFPLMPRLFMSVQMEDRFPIIDILDQTPEIPMTCQWAIFLRNHDELTLEMVTDEDRDYMYRRYAQDPQARVNLGIRRRLAPLLGNNRRLIELMNGLLFSLPGTPVLYYGDEIGMGDNIYLGDRNGVRTPMQWSADRNAGFSRANPQKLYLPVIIEADYHYESLNIEFQQANPNSLWWAMRRLIAVRKQHRAFGWGSFEFLYPDNRKVLVYIRTLEEERILVVANLARYMQSVELDLSAYEGLIPIDVFGQTPLPTITDQLYFLTLAPHTFYWLSLERPEQGSASFDERPLPTLSATSRWTAIFQPESRSILERILSRYLYSCPWFTDRNRRLQSLKLQDVVPVTYGSREAVLTLLMLEFNEGDPCCYLLPLTYLTGDPAVAARLEQAHSVIAYLHIRQAEADGILCDAFADHDFLTFPLDTIQHSTQYQGSESTVLGRPVIAELLPEVESGVHPRLLRLDQSNHLITYGDQFSLKFYRKLEDGIHPDLDIGGYLTRQDPHNHIFPIVVGALSYQRGSSTTYTLGILQKVTSFEGDAWHYTVDELDRYFERILVHRTSELPLISSSPLLTNLELEIPDLAYETIGSPYLDSAYLLGQRTAEFHSALSQPSADSNFNPEPFSRLYQRSIYQSMRNLVGQVLPLLTQYRTQLPDPVQPLALQVEQRRDDIYQRFRPVMDRKMTALRIRCHGDYHLGQVLYTGKDFVLDFASEPIRTLGERRLKRCPLRDVAGLLQSFTYAVSQSQRRLIAVGMVQDDNLDRITTWGSFWRFWVSLTFLKSYLEVAQSAAFLPKDPEEFQILLEAYLLEEAINELGYELNHRLDWVNIPLQTILGILES